MGSPCCGIDGFIILGGHGTNIFSTNPPRTYGPPALHGSSVSTHLLRVTAPLFSEAPSSVKADRLRSTGHHQRQHNGRTATRLRPPGPSRVRRRREAGPSSSRNGRRGASLSLHPIRRRRQTLCPRLSPSPTVQFALNQADSSYLTATVVLSWCGVTAQLSTVTPAPANSA